MNSENSINGEDLRTLFSINTEKMNFQQSICIQIRNWAFGITGIFIPLVWSAEIKSLTIAIMLHIVTIALIGLILYKDLCWHTYFFLFCDRAQHIENVILKQKDLKSLVKMYYEHIKPDEKSISPEYDKLPKKLFKDSIKSKHLISLKNDYVVIYLILILMVSLIAKIVTVA